MLNVTKSFLGGKILVVNRIFVVRGLFVFQKLLDNYCACAALFLSCGAGARAA